MCWDGKYYKIGRKKKQDIGNYCSACIHINILKEPLTPSPPNTNKKSNHQPRAMYKGYKRPRLLFSHTYLYVFVFYNFIKKKMALVTWCLIQLWEKNNQSNLTHGISVLSWHISNDYKQKKSLITCIAATNPHFALVNLKEYKKLFR